MKKISIILVVLVLSISTFLYLEPYNEDSEKHERNHTKEEQVNTPEETYVYESDAESPDDCTSFEKYDEERKTCYYECDTEAECAEILKSIDEEINSWLDESTPEDRSSQFESEGDAEKNLVSEYRVDKGEKITLSAGKPTTESEQIWDHISRISPDQLSDKHIAKFMIFDDNKSETLAFVDSTDNEKWRIAINLPKYNESSTREKNITILHELAHIVTLNNTQITPESGCITYSTNEGCSLKNSYLNNFVSNFWKKEYIKKAKSNENIYNQESFVTEYAASSPEEDISESFAYFIIDTSPSTENIKHKKTNFFYTYPDLVDIREKMRAGVYNDIVRARKLKQPN